MYDQLMQRLRKPGGRLGTLSLVSAAILGVVGLVGAVAMILSLVADLDFWADDNGGRFASLVFFLVMMLGAVGFVIEDEHAWAGGVLGALGGAALATILFWTVLAVVVGLGVAVVAVFRARELHHPSAPRTRPAH
jgi:hypothetical protein